MTSKVSNKLRLFYELKAKHPDALMLFRCGDFYECYKDDATNAAKVLGITVTNSEVYGTLAGFPHHALDTYLPRLTRAGHRVAICDDLSRRFSLRRPSAKVQLPKLTKEQHELLCECIRYRCADLDRERYLADHNHLSTVWIDNEKARLNELKEIIYNLK